MLKKQYVTPEFELYKVRLEEGFLVDSLGSGNVQSMTTVNGTWEDEED